MVFKVICPVTHTAETAVNHASIKGVALPELEDTGKLSKKPPTKEISTNVRIIKLAAGKACPLSYNFLSNFCRFLS